MSNDPKSGNPTPAPASVSISNPSAPRPASAVASVSASGPAASVSIPRAGAPQAAAAPPAMSPPPAAPAQAAPTPPPAEEPTSKFPREPKTWEELGLDPIFGEQLIVRYLLVYPTKSGRDVANDLCLHPPLVKEILENLKTGKFVQHRGLAGSNDFMYELSEAGRSKAVDAKKVTTYVGPAPVPFDQYARAVKGQSLTHKSPGPEDLARAFYDLTLPDDMMERLGPAVSSCRAMFLHGEPGNGKTSIAERITRCFGDTIWIPQTLMIDGHLVKIFDPGTHEMVEPNIKVSGPNDKLDRRWVRIKRPTVIAGGELTMDMLEIQPDPLTNVCEPPLQLKANCGTLVIDDFGRQRVPPQQILNRWIFPLEKRIDFQRLPDGRKIQVPFDILLVFSTNLEPSDLADEAFLRRIPYKLHVHDASEDEFRGLIESVAVKMKIQLPKGSVNYLMDRHYKTANRPFRFCHPRDLLMQVTHICNFERRASIAGPREWDRVVSNYFGKMPGH